jgi:hypothetical protein
MNGIEEAVEFRVIHQAASEASRMTVPDLPLLSLAVLTVTEQGSTSDFPID